MKRACSDHLSHISAEFNGRLEKSVADFNRQNSNRVSFKSHQSWFFSTIGILWWASFKLFPLLSKTCLLPSTRQSIAVGSFTHYKENRCRCVCVVCTCYSFLGIVVFQERAVSLLTTMANPILSDIFPQTMESCVFWVTKYATPVHHIIKQKTGKSVIFQYIFTIHNVTPLHHYYTEVCWTGIGVMIPHISNTKPKDKQVHHFKVVVKM